MLAAVDGARRLICLETYIYAPSPLGDQFRNALVAASQRGVDVRVLVDAVGSVMLPDEFWQPLRAAGGQARWFNPITLKRFAVRNHRKLLVCDDVAFIGGFNIAPEYEGDGVTRGWCDVGLRLEGALVAELATSFDEMFARADFRHKRFLRLRQFAARRTVAAPEGQLLLSGPGRGWNPFLRSFRRDLAKAQTVQCVVAYFLPSWRLRRDLARVARRGGQVQLVLAGKSDVPLVQAAAQSLYRRLLKAGVALYEYQPQILHGKLFLVDGAGYVGSANLDPRSLRINYELMVRFEHEPLVTQARAIFACILERCRRIELPAWRESRTWLGRLRQRWAYFLLARLDPYVASWQYRKLQE